MKEEIRPIYSELQGYLARAPETGGTYDEAFWAQINTAIDELSQVSGRDYTKFKVAPRLQKITSSGPGYPRMDFDIYRTNLGGLIARLHGEYFSNESPPFQTMPNTVITQTQNQSQSVSLLLDIQEKILTEIPKHQTGSKERTFLEQVKGSLPTLKTGLELISSILNIGKDMGLTAAEVHNLLRF